MATQVAEPHTEIATTSESSPAPIWDRPFRPTWMRLLNGAGASLRKVGVRWPRLDSEAMLADARRRSGLTDFGDDDFHEGLVRLVRDFEAQDNAHTFGRFYFREYCVRNLVNRLRIQDDLNRHPEILDTPVERPLFVTGLPRSGTTTLHRLLSEDPDGRPLLFWETLEPAPAPATDPRLAERKERCRKAVRTLNALAPRLTSAHLFDADSPEECNNLFAHRFIAGINGFMFDVPGYVRWMEGQDLTPGYRYLKAQLQILSWRTPTKRWLLKAPAHLFAIDAIIEVFPDARVVMTHRDPLQFLPSVCSMSAAFRGIVSDRVDLRRLGAEYNQAMALGTERALASRARHDPSRFFDIYYPNFLADPVGSALSVHRHFGDPIDPAFEPAMRRWLAANPQHKYGVHRYALDDFGLTPEAVNESFAVYRRWIAENQPGAV